MGHALYYPNEKKIRCQVKVGFQSFFPAQLLKTFPADTNQLEYPLHFQTFFHKMQRLLQFYFCQRHWLLIAPHHTLPGRHLARPNF